MLLFWWLTYVLLETSLCLAKVRNPTSVTVILKQTLAYVDAWPFSASLGCSNISHILDCRVKVKTFTFWASLSKLQEDFIVQSSYGSRHDYKDNYLASCSMNTSNLSSEKKGCMEGFFLSFYFSFFVCKHNPPLVKGLKS